jgi:hypothetical protein
MAPSGWLKTLAVPMVLAARNASWEAREAGTIFASKSALRRAEWQRGSLTIYGFGRWKVTYAEACERSCGIVVSYYFIWAYV